MQAAVAQHLNRAIIVLSPEKWKAAIGNALNMYQKRLMKGKQKKVSLGIRAGPVSVPTQIAKVRQLLMNAGLYKDEHFPWVSATPARTLIPAHLRASATSGRVEPARSYR